MVNIPYMNDPEENNWDTVDGKLAEAEFFLQKMAKDEGPSFDFQCYLSAYLSAARTATLAMQHFGHIPGHTAWYETQRAKLKRNSLAKFMLNARNEHIHGGPYPIAGGMFHQGKSTYRFAKLKSSSRPPTKDILTACRDHFILLLEVALSAYKKLGVHIDPQQYFTKQHFKNLGRSIDDAEVELYGWICDSLIEEGLTKDDRWHELRGHVGECQINHLFYSYLGRSTPPPREPAHYADFAFTSEDKGWEIIPAGFDSYEEYIRQYPRRKRRDE